MTLHAYRADRAFDGERWHPQGLTVFTDGSRITGVDAVDAAVPHGYEVAYIEGATLLPGLIDTHVHLCGDGGPRALDQLPELDTAQLDTIIDCALRDQLRAGVTTVRDLGDINWAVVDRHRRHDGGPRVLGSGPPITTEGGHCANMGGAADGPGALRDAVRERVEHGVDVVKVMASGGFMTAGSDVTACPYTVDDLRVLVDAAHAAGLPITAHAHAIAAVERCVAAGVDGIEHCSCLTPTGFRTPPALAAALVAANVAVCPTLGRVPGMDLPPQIVAVLERTNTTWADRLVQVFDLYRAGVRLISGADAGISPLKPHGVLPLAIVDMVGIGLTPAHALASATGLAADACGLTGSTGRLRAGLDADLLLVDGDPAADITAITRAHTVVARGVRLSQTCS
jgi:imidazolonepropionase-like amidohydrolase